MERLINEIDSRIRNFYYYGATREGMSWADDSCKCIVNITNEQALAYLREKKNNTYLARCCKWNIIHKFADFYNDGLIVMMESKWNESYKGLSSYPPRIKKSTNENFGIGDISSYDGFHDLKIVANDDGKEFDIVITVYTDDDSFMYERGDTRYRKEKCTFIFKSTNTEVNEYILSLLRSSVERDIYHDTIKATKERIIEKLMFGTFLSELAENPYCSIDDNAIRR